MITFESSSQCVCAACCGFELLSRASPGWDELLVEIPAAIGGGMAVVPTCKSFDQDRRKSSAPSNSLSSFSLEPQFFVVIMHPMISAAAGAFPRFFSNGYESVKAPSVGDHCCGGLGIEFFVLRKHKRSEAAILSQTPM
jgi:hypothetical protein